MKTVLADQGSNEMCFPERLCGATEDWPLFLHNQGKVRVMYDPVHLLRKVKKNSKNSGFIIDEKEVQWMNIEQFCCLFVCFYIKSRVSMAT